jgi:glycine/D-amino acid oxidase-like deaminating enzyme
MPDFLIVGQGLAGSLLSFELAKFGQSVCMLDDGHKTSSSKMAAGLINPLAGKRLTLQPETEKLLETAISTFKTLEMASGLQFWHPLDMLRVFMDVTQHNLFLDKQKDKDYRKYLGEFISYTPSVNTPYGAFIQKQCGYINLPAILEWFRGWLKQSHQLIDLQVDYNTLQNNKDSVSLNGITARKLVFCEGYRGHENPWFNFLPYQLAKGEIIDLKIKPHYLTNKIVNAGEWLIPVSNTKSRFGATTSWNEYDTTPTEAGRKKLLAAFRERFITEAYEVTASQAGIRPATKDRQPFIGSHPELQGLNIFNGFGSKGCLLIPYHARDFARHLVFDEPLDTFGSIRRYA